MVKMEEKIKQKRGWCGMGDTMKMACDVGRVNDEKKSKAAARCNGREADRVDCNARRGLRSSSFLRVVAIQAINIFIRGCYL